VAAQLAAREAMKVMCWFGDSY